MERFEMERVDLLNIIAVGLGGFFGAILRYKLGEWLPLPNGFPLGTLLINWAGCFFLAWFLNTTLHQWKLPPAVRLGIGTGFTGAFTTFSTFSVETLNLLQSHRYFLAAVYIVFSALGGISLSYSGYHLAVRLGTSLRPKENDQ